jgi:putative effector of murein hydrolase
MSETVNLLVTWGSTPAWWLSPQSAGSALAAMGLTAGVYLLAQKVYRALGMRVWALPVLTALPVLLLVMSALPQWLGAYMQGTQALASLLGPATVAMAVPLWRQWPQVRRAGWRLLLALLLGSVAAMLATLAAAWSTGLPLLTTVALSPKSATMPVAIASASAVGGSAAMASLAVVLTGVLATLMAGPVWSAMGVRGRLAQGFSLGLAAHAIGTARAMQNSPEQGAYAALGMGLNAVATSALMPLAYLLALWVFIG